MVVLLLPETSCWTSELLLRIEKAGYASSMRVTSPKGAKKRFFNILFDVFGPRDWFQSLLQALRFNFPSKMLDLDAYVSSYVTFRRF